MALIENTLDGLINKVDIAIQRLRYFEPPEGYVLAYSGGKDSVCILRLAQMAGVKFDAIYNVTTVDPPELVRFVKATPGVQFQKARFKDGTPVTMWNLIPKNRMPPTRTARYCCAYFKEQSSIGRILVTGVRWAESARRKRQHGIASVMGRERAKILNLDNDDARRMVEQCYRTHKTLVNPIVDWEDEDVWEFIRTEKIPYCGLYDEGYKRLGCIGCPMNPAAAAAELERYPKYKAAYIRAFNRMLDARKEAGMETKLLWRTGEEVMDWWLGKSKNKDLPLFEDEGEE